MSSPLSITLLICLPLSGLKVMVGADNRSTVNSVAAVPLISTSAPSASTVILCELGTTVEICVSPPFVFCAKAVRGKAAIRHKHNSITAIFFILPPPYYALFSYETVNVTVSEYSPA